MKEEIKSKICKMFNLRPEQCDGEHAKYGCDLEKLNFIEDLIFDAKISAEMEESIKRYNQAKEDGTLDKHFPKI